MRVSRILLGKAPRLCQARTNATDIRFDSYQVAFYLIVLGIPRERGLQDRLRSSELLCLSQQSHIVRHRRDRVRREFIDTSIGRNRALGVTRRGLSAPFGIENIGIG